jgi:glutathione S-transferase
MMTTMLRILRDTDLVAEFANLARYQARCEARPAFGRALEAQLAPFKKHEPAEAA